MFYVVRRERGIEIDLVSDRKKGGASASTASTKFVKFVKIPCDESKPFVELSIPVEEGKAGDQFSTLLRVYFNQGALRLDDVKGAAAKQFSNQDINISQETLTKLGQEGSVEVFPLAHPNDFNQNCKVSFYLDEVGQLKNLQRNQRASQFAELCGFKDVPLVGDIFIGRVGPSNLSGGLAKGPVNLDFQLSELSSDAAWLKDVVKHNYEAGLKSNRVAMESDVADQTQAVSAEVEVGGAEGVKWSETAAYVELSVAIPAEIKKFTTKDINVKIQAAKISIKIKNNTGTPIERPSPNNAGTAVVVVANEFVTLWEGALHGTISVDDSSWSVDGHKIELALEKSGSSQGMWKKLTSNSV